MLFRPFCYMYTKMSFLSHGFSRYSLSYESHNVDFSIYFQLRSADQNLMLFTIFIRKKLFQQRLEIFFQEKCFELA